MTEPTTLGAYLRRERERRGLALRTISENTKVSIGLLEGLEADDISRWPGGIFRRAFVRAYAQCVGLDADDIIRRFETQFPTEPPGPLDSTVLSGTGHPVLVREFSQRTAASRTADLPIRSRVLGTAADLAVAVVLAFGCAAAGSRLLWPVLMIACYYAAGVMMTGTSPMVALLADGFLPARKTKEPARPAPTPPPAAVQAPEVPAARATGRHARRSSDRSVRQRRGMQAPV
jgi:transcriptional regulator with XRE-family HTH domain